MVPISEMAEHMRISLIDPKYKEQKERMLAKLRENTLAGDDEISRNIVGLARTRPDIFGTTAEEVSEAMRQEVEKNKAGGEGGEAGGAGAGAAPRVMWDGHAASITQTAKQVRMGTRGMMIWMISVCVCVESTLWIEPKEAGGCFQGL